MFCFFIGMRFNFFFLALNFDCCSNFQVKSHNVVIFPFLIVLVSSFLFDM